MNNFIIADLVAVVSRIYFYDERGQDKGADALCTLGMLYYLWNLALRVRFLFFTIVSDKTSPNC